MMQTGQSSTGKFIIAGLKLNIHIVICISPIYYGSVRRAVTAATGMIWKFSGLHGTAWHQWLKDGK